MDESGSPGEQPPPRRGIWVLLLLASLWVLGVYPGYLNSVSEHCWLAATTTAEADGFTAAPISEAAMPGADDLAFAGERLLETAGEKLTVAVLVGVLTCILLSAFFSGSEAAFFSLHRLRLRSMREERSYASRSVARLMEHPGKLLATILVGNTLVNVTFSVLLGTRVENTLAALLHIPVSVAYAIAVVTVTLFLVTFGEVAPKVFAVHAGERFARAAVFPLMAINKLLAPLRDGLMGFTDGLFRLIRFHEVRTAPFMTDEEFRAMFTEGEAKGVIKEDERQMIEGILEFDDALLREILVPRPDVVALPETATAAQAMNALREHEFSRMPVFEDNLDHVTGVVVAKDLLPIVAAGDMSRCVKEIMRRPFFVPETMTVRQFVNAVRRHRSHMAVVVDEYGGTAGIVTLENALEQVIGQIRDEDEEEELGYVRVDDSVWRVQGGVPLDELSDLIGVELEDEEHETLAGFLMAEGDKIPEPGDTIEHAGVRFVVEACDGKRASLVRVELAQPDAGNGEEGRS